MLESYTKAPFPYMGGKRHAAPLIWSLLGDVHHYVEGFMGSLAVLLERPHPCNRPYYSETVSDTDGLLVNAWRSIQQHPEATAAACSWPVSEADKHARQAALLAWRATGILDLLAGSPEWCDPQMGGWWLYSVCAHIGAFHGKGPWTADPVTGRLVKRGGGAGVTRDLPHLSDNGQGVHHAGLREPGLKRSLPHLSDNGKGVHHAGLREPGLTRSLPHLTDNGHGVHRPQLREPGVGEDPEFHPLIMPELGRWFQWLAARLRHVRIVNGDWSRVCTPGARLTLPVRQGDGYCGVFLDPPYAPTERDSKLYMQEGDFTVAVQAWCLATGTDPRTRIVLAGYDTEHQILEAHGWTVHEWYTAGFLRGGYGNVDGTSQQHRERLWASPSCHSVAIQQLALL